MTVTKKDRRSYFAGEKGRNRVRVFPDPKTGMYQMEWRENGQRRSKSLKHRDWDQAKEQADLFAAQYVQPTQDAVPESEPLTLGKLFDMYLEEVTPTKGAYTQKHDRRAVCLFVDFWERDREVSSLNRRDWDAFIKARRSGQLSPDGSRSETGVGNRTIEQNLQFARAVFNWALVAGDAKGAPLLDRNPFQGLPLPKEKNPVRVLIGDEEYQSLLAIAPEIEWRFHVALVLAHETGHRIGAIRQLRWSDVDLDKPSIRWKADTDKSGREHETPITPEAKAALTVARKEAPGIGDAPVLPSPSDATKCVSRHLTRDWWDRAEEKAELEPRRGRGWHALRRKFASDLVDEPLKVLADLGGWKSTQTIIECYQRPDQDRLREALEGRQRVASGSKQRE